MSGKRPKAGLDNLFGDDGSGSGGFGDGGNFEGGSGGRSPDRLKEFAASAQSKYLFDQTPLYLKGTDGRFSHAIEKRAPWSSDVSNRLEPFEASAVRDIFIDQFGNEARKLRQLPERPNRAREIFKDIEYNGNTYHIRVKYFSSHGGYYEATLYRYDK